MTNSKKITYLHAGQQGARMLIVAIHAAYLISTGVSLKDLAYLQMVFSTTMLLLEFPTGVFADTVSRKTSVLLSCILLSLYYPICFFAPNLTALTTSEVVYGTALSLISGAIQGWLVSSVNHEYEDEKKQISYYNHFVFELAALGMMVSGPIGALIAKKGTTFSFKTVYAVASLSMIFLTVSFSRVVEYKSEPMLATEKHKRKIKDYARAICGGTRTIFGTKPGLLYLGISCLITMVYQPVFHFWQPLFLGAQKAHPISQSLIVGLTEVTLLGIIFFLSNFLSYGINKYVRTQLLATVSPIVIGLVSSLIVSCLFILIGYMADFSTLGLLVFYCLLRAFLTLLEAVTGTLFYQVAPATELASAISASKVVGRVLAIATLSVIAFLVDKVGLSKIYMLTSVPVFLLVLLFSIWNHPILRGLKCN